MQRRLTKVYLLCLAALLMVSGCATVRSNTPPRGMVVRAVEGAAIGTPIGCAVAAVTDYDDLLNYAIGCGGGAIVGAVLGAAWYEAPPPPPPPPPPPKVVKAPPPPPPPPPRMKEKLVLRGVHFDFNKADIRPEDEPVLDEAVETLKTEPNVRIYVDGYCDIIGSEEYNLKLSARRAAAVAMYLEQKGIGASRLIPRGFGKTHFVATNETDEGRAQNRRVELVPVE